MKRGVQCTYCMSVSRGARLGPYEILEQIGEGGMGEVWSATDTRLGRRVAIKISKTPFGNRFEREARAVAALNHPNICTLHDVGADFLVMELIEGERLRGPVPLAKAVAYARQILDALDAAHRVGIVHRDLKPANILITKQGVKLLDFGLAKQRETFTPAEAGATELMTRQGEIAGTLQYMSPEQLQGRQADVRSDLFSFGCVLYEMLTGKPAFAGSSAASVIAAILDREPANLESTFPVDSVIRVCLAKDPEERWQNARDVKQALTLAVDRGDSRPPTAVNVGRRWAIASVIVALAAAGLAMLSSRRPPEYRPMLLLELEHQIDRGFAISRDGTRLAATLPGFDRIAIRHLDSDKWVELPGTEFGNLPFFSPDGQWLGFFARRKLSKVATAGGVPIILCDAPNGRGGSWADDNTIVAALDITGGLSIIPADGGPPKPLTGLHGETADAAAHRFPHVLPDGRGVIFTSLDGQQHSLWHVPLRGGNPRLLLRDARDAAFINGGFLVYFSQRMLLATPINLERVEISGTPITLAAGVRDLGRPLYAVARTGNVVYAPGPVEVNTVVSWIDSSGNIKPLLPQPARYHTPRLSPDGKRLAVAIERGAGANVWVYDWIRDTMTPLPAKTEYQFYPTWSPDGEHIAFQALGKLALARSDGSGDVEILPAHRQAFPSSFTPAGNQLFLLQVSDGDYDTFVMDIDTRSKSFGSPRLLGGSVAKRYFPAVSPDGKWLAYSATSAMQVQVAAVTPSGELAGGQWAISNEGGSYPRWARDRQELFYFDDRGRIMAVSYTVQGDKFVAQKPRVWSDIRLGGRPGGHFAYDPAPDGSRIVALLPQEGEPEKQAGRLKILVNVDAELRRQTGGSTAR